MVPPGGGWGFCCASPLFPVEWRWPGPGGGGGGGGGPAPPAGPMSALLRTSCARALLSHAGLKAAGASSAAVAPAACAAGLQAFVRRFGESSFLGKDEVRAPCRAIAPAGGGGGGVLPG